jgi:hypothetical protein
VEAVGGDAEDGGDAKGAVVDNEGQEKSSLMLKHKQRKGLL